MSALVMFVSNWEKVANLLQLPCTISSHSRTISRIAIDIVGPSSVCRDTGSRFILTIVDHCTHFPEAVPLVTHEAADVAKALVSVLSHFGFAREILSDCCSEFLFQLSKVFLEEFGIKHVRTSPYHPATNGSCERFNGTLKSMLRAVAEDFPYSWDHVDSFLILRSSC